MPDPESTSQSVVRTFRPYVKEDFEMVSAWHHHHTGRFLEESVLPPVGIVVENNGPESVLWAYEPARSMVAFLELPVSRPGLPPPTALASFVAAIEGLIQICGKQWEPPGEYSVFRVCTSPAIARMLLRIGWKRESEQELIPMIYRKPCQP